jgi:hypothetical protein
MVVGACELRLVVRGARSLKEKRQAVRSIKDRLAELFPVAVAEVDDLDKWQSIVLGVAAVGNDGRHVQSLLQSVVDKVAANPHAELVRSEIEILT